MSNEYAIREFIKGLGEFYPNKMTAGVADMLWQELSPFAPSQIKGGLRTVCMEKSARPNVGYMVDVVSKTPSMDVMDGERDAIDGELSNGQVCSCGMHHGVGTWSPEAKAKAYKWHQRKYNTGFTHNRANWLESWEKKHDIVSG